MTSDGIKDEHWDKVTELCLRIANDTQHVNPDLERISIRELFSYLDELEGLYGRLPSLLATKADFVPDSEDPMPLWLEAFSTAAEMQDGKNQLYTACSIANYLANNNNHREALKWIERAENLLYLDLSERDNLMELKTEATQGNPA